MAKEIVYIFDNDLQKECDRLPVILNRASIVHDLIVSYNLLGHEGIAVTASQPATDDELKYFHSSAYVDFLIKHNHTKDLDDLGDEQLEFGLGYDCPVLPRLYDLVATLAGGTLTAAKLLAARKCKIAINWTGGWHHAQRDEAEGFCYVNDVVIGIQKLTEIFPKILYVDLDIHHGNGVENAFELSQKILTLSFHKYSPGFYPGTGNVDNIGSRKGKYYAVNVPLLEGFNNATFAKCFSRVFHRIADAFCPSALVVQCGADVINGDPIGEANTTPKGMGFCIREILKLRHLPILFLGGGGYNFPNTARYWTYLTSIILGIELDNDIPDSSEYFTEYAPSYELHLDDGNQKDHNTDESVDKVVGIINSYCDVIYTNSLD